MKTSLVIAGPDLSDAPLCLLSGSFEERVRKAAELGYDGVELMVQHPDSVNPAAVRDALSAACIELPQIVTGQIFGAEGLCLVTGDEDTRRRAVQRTQEVIDLAASLGAMVNLGRLRGQLRFLGRIADPWATAVCYLRPIVQYAQAKDVRVTVEPVNRYESDFVLNAVDGVRLLQDLDCPNLGLMLDVFHMNIEDASIEDGLKLAGDRLWHMHIADSNRGYPGSGHVRFETIFAVLREMDYRGFLSAELLAQPDPDTAARKTIEFLKEGTGQGGRSGVDH